MQTALAQAAELLGLRTGWVWLLREESGDSYLAASQNLPPALAKSPHRMEGTCYCLDTYRAGDLNGAANVNVVTCSRLKWLVDGTDGLRYHASIPLYAHGKKLGVMNVASPDWRELSPDDLRLLYTVGDLLSIAIERARLFDRSVQLGAAEERNRLAARFTIRWRKDWPRSRCSLKRLTPCLRRILSRTKRAKSCSTRWP